MSAPTPIFFTRESILFPIPNVVQSLLIDINQVVKSSLSPGTIISIVPLTKREEEDISQSLKQKKHEEVNKKLIGKVSSLARVIGSSKRQTDTIISISVEVLLRARIKHVDIVDNRIRASVEALDEQMDTFLSQASKAIETNFFQIIRKYLDYNSGSRFLIRYLEPKQDNAGLVADIVTSSLPCSFEDKRKVFEAVEIDTRLQIVTELLSKKMVEADAANEVNQSVKSNLAKSQKEFYLKEQMKAIQKELGEDSKDDLSVLGERLQNSDMPNEVRVIAERELSKLRGLSPQQIGYEMNRSYLECLVDLPWKSNPNIQELTITEARSLLDSDHYALEEPKNRILEFLAVRAHTRNESKLLLSTIEKVDDNKSLVNVKVSSPILCLVGPPGVGKTSIAASIAKALSRKLVRVSLGGVHDEADIRGHRRTYVGAMPGRLIQAIRRAKTKDVVILLDEIDKTGKSFNHGDVSSALLEVLDSEQNNSFLDHYLNVPYDLSDCVFIATANRRDSIPKPLLDRMEIITLSGYTHYEKYHIATKHIIPKQLSNHKISSESLKFQNDSLSILIKQFTQEAGVRELERKIGRICRYAILNLEEERNHNDKIMIIDEKKLESIFGPPMVDSLKSHKLAIPGIAIGLVWTEVGGKIMFVEATTMEGKGDIILTGQLGDVIKESAQIAVSWVRSHFSNSNLLHPNILSPSPTQQQQQQQQISSPTGVIASPAIGFSYYYNDNNNNNTPFEFQNNTSEKITSKSSRSGSSWFENTDLHIHFPAGAVPKDGPSAGVTLVTVLTSLLTKKCVRDDTAMTGEITLQGTVLPVGGIKEKVIAAHSAGVKRVILPESNRSDLLKVPKEVKESIEFIFVQNAEQVLAAAFSDKLPAISKL